MIGEWGMLWCKIVILLFGDLVCGGRLCGCGLIVYRMLN